MHAVAVRDSPKLGGWGGTWPKAFVGSPKLMNSNSPNGRGQTAVPSPASPQLLSGLRLAKKYFILRPNKGTKQTKNPQKTKTKAFYVFQYTSKREISGKH